MPNRKYGVVGGASARDYAHERFIDSPQNRPNKDRLNPQYRSDCFNLLVGGLRFLDRFPLPEGPPARKEGPLFLGTPRFDYLMPDRDGQGSVHIVGEMSLYGVVYATRTASVVDVLAEGRFDDLDLTQTRWNMQTHVDGDTREGRRLMTVTALEVTRFDATGEGLLGGPDELKYLQVTLGDMQQDVPRT